MNALTGNKAGLLIFCSIDMNALTGNAENQVVRSINKHCFIVSGGKLVDCYCK
jgi:hypothetical protein